MKACCAVAAGLVFWAGLLTLATVATCDADEVETVDPAPFIDNSAEYCENLRMLVGDVPYPCVKEA